MKIMNTVGSDGGFNYQKKFINISNETSYNTKTISSPETHVIPINGYLGYISILVGLENTNVGYEASFFIDDFECFTWSSSGGKSYSYVSIGCTPLSLNYGANTDFLVGAECLFGKVDGSGITVRNAVQLNKLLDKTTIKCRMDIRQGFVEMVPFKVKNIKIVINKSIVDSAPSTLPNVFRIETMRYLVD